jgi:hypothetical protein
MHEFAFGLCCAAATIPRRPLALWAPLHAVGPPLTKNKSYPPKMLPLTPVCSTKPINYEKGLDGMGYERYSGPERTLISDPRHIKIQK